MKRKLLLSTVSILLLVSSLPTEAKAPSANWERYDPDIFERVQIPPSPSQGDEKAEVIIDTFFVQEVPFERPKIVVPNAPQSSTEPRSAPQTSGVVSKAAAKKYALNRIGETQFACLDKLWTRESHWNYRAYNEYSGAYGIPQALPGSKMATAGEDWRTNSITQVKWGLRYIERRYGSACGAWSFFKSHNWY